MSALKAMSAVMKVKRMIERISELQTADIDEYIDGIFAGTPPELRVRLKEIARAALDYRDGRIPYDEAINRIARAMGVDAGVVLDFVALTLEVLRSTFKKEETKVEW